jgi:catechol 2,3-dioxygenase-like lactoylglutathione lyase family enzyme
MKFILHHLGVACGDFDRSLNWYKNILQNRVVHSWRLESQLNVAFVGRGSDVMSEVVGPPFEPYGRQRLGQTLSHLGIWVDDLRQAFELLRQEGVRIAWEPREFGEIQHFGVLDPHGVLLEFFNSAGELPLARPEPNDSIRLHHVSLLTPDLRRTEQFFAKLHMKTVIEHTENHGGFLFMIDEGFDYRNHNFMLEVIGPPRTKVRTATALLEPREQAILEKHGACLDHVCYVADDVPSTYAEFTARGAFSTAPPYRDYGSWISWLKDPDGKDIELLTPIPESVITLALRRNAPLQTMGITFDAGRQNVVEAAVPPWRDQQLENLRNQL